MKTAVIYARVSSSNDRQDTSRQIEDLKKYAISQDIEIVNIFQEHISGAKRIEERQILGECLEYCKHESVNILLLSELSRLGRSTLQVLRSLDILHARWHWPGGRRWRHRPRPPPRKAPFPDTPA